MVQDIEFVQGQESHSSSWGKLYVKGLEEWQIKEDFEENIQDKHHSYQGFVACEIEDNTIFTIFEQSGDKRGTHVFKFSILRADSSLEKTKYQPEYGEGFLEASFEVIAEGLTKVKAPRLLGWWSESSKKDIDFARHCAIYIKKRGVKNLPPM